MLDGTVTRDDDSGVVIGFDRLIARPVEKVWAALTVPERIADWIGTAEVELRVGGRYRLAFYDSDGCPPGVMDGMITAVEPPRRLELTWREGDQPPSVVRWTLEPAPGGCHLRLTHAFPPGVQDVLSYVGGWHDFLEMIVDAADGVRKPYDSERWRRIDAQYRAWFADVV